MPLLWPDDSEPTTRSQNTLGFAVAVLWIAFILWVLVNSY